MKKTALLLMVITVISKILGFVREISLSYFYGASNTTDAYLISQTIPIVIFALIGTGISTGYVPLYSKIQEKHGVKEGIRYTNNLISILLTICTCIVILGILFTGQIVKLFASGFEHDTLILAVQFTRISLVGIYFTGLIHILGSFLRIKGNYSIPALIGFPYNLIIILFIFLSSKSDVWVLAVGSLIALAVQFGLLVPFAHKQGYRYKFKIDLKDEYIIKMVTIALPVIIGVSVNEVNVIVDRTLASGIAVGGISALNYARRLNAFIQGIFVTTVATAMYPIISKMAAQSNFDGLKKSVSEAINLINLFVIPATVGAMIFAEPVVKLLFGRGAFDPEAISMTSNALFFYSIGMIGFGLREILSRAFYSMQDTKTPMINAAIAMGMNIVLNIILSRFLGLGGLALATSISAIFCTGLLFVSLRKKIGAFGMKNTTISLIKILVASLVMGIVAYLAYDLLLSYFSGNLSLIISICIGALVYFVIVYFMKVDEVETLVNAAKKRLKERA
ncbi:MAG: murein biosynthesis integral membrane protein MurJ [Tepidanaerobacteraceae bacterium]